MKTTKFSGSKTRLQIAEEYEISYPTLWRKIKTIGLNLPGGLLPPKWQKMIYDSMGYPPGISPKDYTEST